MAMGFYIDNAGCWGCKTCSVACAVNRQTADDTFMRRVTDIREDGTTCVSFLSMSCNHCAKPACVDVCPQGAYTKLDNGIVQQDHSKCIGCKACIEACPYDAPVYRESEGKTYKCDMCIDRLDAGLQPWCVDACPGANLAVGELDDLKAKHPEGVQEIPDVTPEASQTEPSIVIELDKQLA